MIGVLTSGCDIILICESWLPESVSDSELGLHDFSIYRCDRDYDNRKDSKGGGVLIAVRKSIKSSLICSDNKNKFESLFVKIWLCNKPILLNISYIQPQSNLETYENLLTFIESTLHKDRKRSRILITGDFNLPTVAWSSIENDEGKKVVYEDLNLTPQAETVLDFSKCYSLHQMNDTKNQNNRTLDLIFTNFNS